MRAYSELSLTNIGKPEAPWRQVYGVFSCFLGFLGTAVVYSDFTSRGTAHESFNLLAVVTFLFLRILLR
jgi:hypothetical protein